MTIFVFLLIGFTNCTRPIEDTSKTSPAGDPTPNETAQPTPSPTHTPLAKGDRILGVHISEPQNGFNSGYASSSQIKFDVVNLHFPWGKGTFSGTLPVPPLETNSSSNCVTSSSYNMTYINYAHAFYPSYNKKINLTIAPYDGNNKFVPQCATSMAMNSSTVKTMFNYVLANVFAVTETVPKLELSSLLIGNEIDLHTDFQTCQVSPQLSNKWQEFKEFFEDQRNFVHGYLPNLKMGVTATFKGLTDSTLQPCFTQLFANADFISVTYYPMNNDFTVKDPSVVANDFSTLIQKYPGKIIYFQEVGYSSGSDYVASSQSKQAEFYKNIFRTWDNHFDQIKMISIVNMHEWSDSTVEGFGLQYGLCPGSSCNAFKEYLKTLGVRTYPQDGTDKEAFQKIISESTVRGWN
jgi:hypothetical protein